MDIGKHCFQSVRAPVLVPRPPVAVECLELKLKYVSEPPKFQTFFFFLEKSL